MNKKLAQVVLNDMNKKAEVSLLKKVSPYMWQYKTDKYNFEVSMGYEGMYILDIFDLNNKHVQSEDSFLSLEEVEDFIKNFK